MTTPSHTGSLKSTPIISAVSECAESEENRQWEKEGSPIFLSYILSMPKSIFCVDMVTIKYLLHGSIIVLL